MIFLSNFHIEFFFSKNTLFNSLKSVCAEKEGSGFPTPLAERSQAVFFPLLSNSPPSFSACTLFKLLNGVFFAKLFYRKVALKNHINLFFKFFKANT